MGVVMVRQEWVVVIQCLAIQRTESCGDRVSGDTVKSIMW